METKLNFKRIVFGGLAGGVGMLLVGMIIHGGILEDHYQSLLSSGVLKNPEDMGFGGMFLHHGYLILSGITVAALYAISRKQLGAGPKTALIVGTLVGLMAATNAVAMYVFYNVGGFVPLMTFIDNVAECIVATLIAGWIYKDPLQN